MPDVLPAGARRPQHLLGLLGQSPHRDQQQVAQGRGHPGGEAAGAVVAQQFFHEQRVAVGAAVHLVRERGLRLAAEDAGRKLIGVPPVEPRQFHPLHPGEPAELGEQGANRVGTVQLVGPVGHDDQDAVQDLLPADEESQQVAG